MKPTKDNLKDELKYRIECLNDFINQYVIRTEHNQNHKCLNFIKIQDNFNYSIDSSKAECRPRPYKRLW